MLAPAPHSENHQCSVTARLPPALLFLGNVRKMNVNQRSST
jgi:hypothetical protein